MAQPSYIELCIRALPGEKQQAAREAFRDLLDGREDDGTLTRLLIVFEATSAYGRTIPQEMANVMEKQFRALDERVGRVAERDSASDEQRLVQLKTLLQEHLLEMAKSLSADKLAGTVETLRLSVDRLERSSRRERKMRLAVVAAFMLFAAATGIGGTMAWFHKDHQAGQAAQKQLDVLNAFGVTLRLANGGNQSLLLSIKGTAPIRKGTWLLDDMGKEVGVEILVPPPQ